MSKAVLSTKKLLPNQRELLLNTGLGLVEIDFISIEPIDFEIQEIPENLIFTSKNAVKAIFDHERRQEMQQKKIFCVGEKTADFLRKNNFEVVATAHSGARLGAIIAEKHKASEFLFFCGRKRNDDLPEILKKNNVQLSEVQVYDTQLTPKQVERVFDGVLFFSPSGVESFCFKNALFDTPAFCIGHTTASEAKKYTDNVIVASKPTVENVIVQAIKKLK